MKINSPHFKKQYDLEKAQLIGQGNFAQVFRIYDNDLNQSLAIRKVQKSQSDLDDIVKQKVINEQLKKVQNQNILKIYDIIDTQNAVWYITQYCSGGSLWDVLNLCKDNKMNEKDCLQCVLQISKGVQQLHNHRITHRDLKPQNILLKSKYIPNKPLPLVKLADFGLSTQKIIMQTIAGTKQYIAPQQAKFHNYTNAVDVWSLGIICDQILHGTPYYTGQNNKEVFNKILKMPYKVRDQSIRQSIQNLLLSLLKKKPYERPIIAVIRKNIQLILEEIQNQNYKKIQEKIQKKQNIIKEKENKEKQLKQLEKQKQKEKQKELQKQKEKQREKQKELQKEKEKQREKQKELQRQKQKQKQKELQKQKQKQKQKELQKQKQKQKQKLIQKQKQLKQKQLKRQKQRQKELQRQKQQLNNNSSSLSKSIVMNNQPKRAQLKRSKDLIKQKSQKHIKVQQQNNMGYKTARQSPKPEITSSKKVQFKIPQLKKQQKSSQHKPLKKSPQRINYNKTIIFEQLKFEEKNVDEQILQGEKTSRSQVKAQKSNKSDVSLLIKSSQNSQFVVYKPQKKKINNIVTKTQTLKIQKSDIKQYIDKVQLKKKQLIQKSTQIKLLQKSPSFLPNTSLSSSQFTLNYDNTSQVIKQFKKQYDILNYIQSTDDYDVKIYKKQKQLKKNKQKCINKFNNIKEKLKEEFMRQIDNYIQSFVQKSLK